MAPKPKRTLDAQTLLAAVGQGSATRVYRKLQPIFVQANPADAVFFLQRGKVKQPSSRATASIATATAPGGVLDRTTAEADDDQSAS
jgi:hypothetical protein